ncbi:hypothetical protein [Zunongwangia sp. H14]|uniref:hypothetical protein n=1 Tax=Zunongwangia sp. H14 TaxID=3240792 RepID=UPI003563E654
MKIPKKKILLKSLMYDGLGMLSVAIPLIGPFLDFLWAPYAAGKMSQMYPGKKGKIASILVFLEEILPGTDVIPTFTLMYIYTYIWKQSKASQPRIIEVESY